MSKAGIGRKEIAGVEKHEWERVKDTKKVNLSSVNCSKFFDNCFPTDQVFILAYEREKNGHKEITES